MKIAIGTMVRWSSAAGVLEGMVKSIFLAPNGLQETTPWILISYGKTTAMLCGSDANLKMMKVELI